MPEHARVPARALDAAAMAALRARGGDERAVWLAGCAGAPVVRSRHVVLDGGGGAPPVLAVAEVAAAVDGGRALAERSAADGVTVLAGTVTGAEVPACALAAVLTGRPSGSLLADRRGAVRGPLSALRQLGGEPLARMCGVALGAGEHGLAFIADGPGAVAAACVALRVEPALAARVRVAGAASSPVESALCEAFGLASLVDGAADAAAALAALRRACGG